MDEHPPQQLDLVVIGGGPAGYVAALRGAQLGLKVVLVEKDGKLGGTCLHRGCIPTKALLHTAELLDELRRAKRFGVEVGGEPRVNLAEARRYRDGVIDKNARGIDFLCRRQGVEVRRGTGRLVGAYEVEVSAEEGEVVTLRTRNVLLATGSVPSQLPFAPIDGERIMDSDQILQLESLPERLVVLGGGAVGCEFASIYASLGSEVTLVEMLPRLLPIEDEELSQGLEKAFVRRGLRVHTATRLVSLQRSALGLDLTLQSPAGVKQLVADVLLVAVGRRPVSEGLGLEALGVELEGGFVRVNETMQSSVPHIYAVGDLVKTPLLAHLASAEGILAVEHLGGLRPQPLDYDRVPSCTYCAPEVASVGLSEAEAGKRGYEVKTGRFPFSASGKAAILGHTDGFVKVVADAKYDELLGVHIVGPRATDLIAEACVALQVESTTEELFRAMHAHPTLSESLAEAALALHGRGLHA